jgi:tetrahydromethanopterin S-methyltransferase subunit B
MARVSAAQEIALMKQRMDSMEEKLDKMDDKLDMLTKNLLDPDKGVVSRVNKNTSARLTMQKALWGLWTIVIGSLVAFFFTKNG